MLSLHEFSFKVETIGDAYMVTSGVPITSRHNHVRDIASVAIMMRDVNFNCFSLDFSFFSFVEVRRNVVDSSVQKNFHKK